MSVLKVLGEPDHGVSFDEPSGQDVEEEILESSADAVVEGVLEEVGFRAERLDDLYPFELGTEHGQWFIRVHEPTSPEAAAAHHAYLSCLAISCFRSNYVELETRNSLAKAVPDVMQQIAWYVAGTLVNGQSYWFGWPRPGQAKGFREALEEIVERSGVGSIRADDPSWATGAEKDGSVDIVAWRRFRDARPGQLYLFGQVASGRNWREKSIMNKFDPYFVEWFTEQPTRHFVPAMFIPFPQHDDCVPSRGKSFEEQATANGRRDERVFGLILDRLRIAELAAESREKGRIRHGVPNGYLVNSVRWLRSVLRTAA